MPQGYVVFLQESIAIPLATAARPVWSSSFSINFRDILLLTDLNSSRVQDHESQGVQ